ncbi:MAG: pyruvate formate lyase family protein [Lentisphaeria bacterium]|nr:pyruvate formate lyase family protein [Lentisphaeria bacterium]
MVRAIPKRSDVQDGERVRLLRERCLQRKPNAWRPSAVPTARALGDPGLASADWQVRKGRVCQERLCSLRFLLDDQELLVGRIAFPDADEQAELPAAQDDLRQYPPPPGQTGHCELWRDEVFSLGLDGLLGRLRERGDDGDPPAVAFRQSAILALTGLQAMITHAGDCAHLASVGERHHGRQAELALMAADCWLVAHAPPETFRQALQLLWLMDLGVSYGESVHLVVPGRLDRSLWRFYQRDCERGRLTCGQAQVLLECLYVLINEFVPDGLAVSVMAGGTTGDGAVWCNELTWLSLAALRRTRLVYPTVGLCWHEDLPAAVVDFAVELVSEGIANVGFFGDATIRKGLGGLGVPAAESGHYINSTCVEITPIGASNVWVASPYFNLCGCLLEEIDAQAAAPAPAPGFEDFLAAFQSRLGRRISDAVAVQERYRALRRQHGRKPLQSVFTRDCLARERDLDDGGAQYNWVECSFVGLANLADSLVAVRDLVYATGDLDFAGLKGVLEHDFAGGEAWLCRCRSLPKYGNGEPEPDRVLAEMVAFMVRECAQWRLWPDNSAFVPGAFCWIMHERLGRETGATPDGRRQGVPFADGCGPAQGRERNGPTSAILSATSWDQSPFIGGAAFNMKFPVSMFRSPEARGQLRDLIVTFLRRGGFETQINVVDGQTLRDAQVNPPAHRDLVVRIGGYTDYFTRISREMQDEILLRTEWNGRC